MPNSVYVGGAVFRPDPSNILGQGGEAVVYTYGRDQALKIYLEPTDPLFEGNPDAQKGARHRLDEQQRKLPAFPGGLPPQVVTPLSLAHDRGVNGRIVGYTMPLVRDAIPLLNFAERDFCEQGGIDTNDVVKAFKLLHGTVRSLHSKHVVIGDFNDLNILVTPGFEIKLVDADSMQFGSWLCKMFTKRFVDPLHCQPDELVLARPHGPTSDWYAFAIMLFQCLTYINPYYGGVHKPKKGKQLRQDSRVLARVSVLSPDVRYPAAALPLQALPDELLGYYSELFERNMRGEFPLKLLEDMRWTSCSNCGSKHARRTCPDCAAPGAVKETVTVHGKVTKTTLFRTTGQIVFATTQGGALRFVYHDRDAYWREGDTKVCGGQLDRELRVRIWGNKTVLAKKSSIVALAPNGDRAQFSTQMYGRLPVFDTNAQHLYWVEGGYLLHDAPLGTTTIGSILPNQTLVWAGERFGFGFFRAGALTRGLIFDATRPGINDSVPLPPMRGNLIDATCVFAKHLAWFFVVIQQGGDIKQHCYVISDSGQLLAHAEAVQGDGTWLGEKNIRGHCAVGSMLFAATDMGIAQIGRDGNGLHVQQEYPDTAPFVNANTKLLPSAEGLVAVSSREIVRLQIRSNRK